MIALLLALALDNPLSQAPACHIRAGVIKSSLSQPRALIYVQYDSEVCGSAPPTFEADTANVSEVEGAEDDDPEKDCGKADAEGWVEDPCPYLSFQARVIGPVGRHVIKVYAENEGYAEVKVTLRGWLPTGTAR